MNRQIRIVGIGLVVLFSALFLQLTRLQVVESHACLHEGLLHPCEHGTSLLGRRRAIEKVIERLTERLEHACLRNGRR